MSAYQTFVTDLDELASYIHHNSETHELDQMNTYDVDTLKRVLLQNKVFVLSSSTVRGNHHCRAETLFVQITLLSGNNGKKRTFVRNGPNVVIILTFVSSYERG